MARTLLSARGLLCAVAAVVVAASALTLPSCLADIPQPTSCPPRDQVPAQGLFAIGPQPRGCWTPPQMASLTGARGDCSCGAGECPVDDDTCYPQGDCPPMVRDVAGEDARCLQLSSANLFWAAPPQPQCGVCGCTRCLARCDGIGPVFGYTTDGVFDASDFFAPLIEVGAQLPRTGTAGVYIRARGVGSAGVLFATGDPRDWMTLSVSTLDTGVPATYLLAVLDEAFQEHVVYNEAFEGNGLMRWDSDVTKPNVIAMIGPSSTPDAETFIEIDCVIPFYLR